MVAFLPFGRRRPAPLQPLATHERDASAHRPAAPAAVGEADPTHTSGGAGRGARRPRAGWSWRAHEGRRSAGEPVGDVWTGRLEVDTTKM
eukprot:scaffold3052_cov389-Prasinococcus_capsulatus_cf.AAC.11